MLNTKSNTRECSVKFLTEDEWMAREQKFMQRLQDLRISTAFINEANKEYAELQTEQLQLDKWNDYLACDGLPRPDFPAEIRNFVVKLCTEEQEATTADINWLLMVNERSILSHAPDRRDITRRNLEVTSRPNIGRLYENTVEGILETHRRVERVLRNEIELLSMPKPRALELTKIPGELHKEIETFFDKLSYRVICAPEAYMTNKGSILSYYCYNCSNFNFQIWGLQDVPIRFQYLKLPLMYSDLKCTGVTLQLPISVLSDNLTLRCVHTIFDPYSHLANSYNVSVSTMNSPICGILDIEDSLTSEWMAQMDIQEDMIAKMDAQMEAYNEEMEIYAAAVAAREKRVGEKEKGPKEPKKPLALPEGKFPDPYKLFLEVNKQNCTDFFYENFHPDQINLLEYEVNLRRYMIMGGVFSLVFLRKPKHTAFEKLNLTLHEDGRVLRVVLNHLDRDTQMDTSQQRPAHFDIDMEADDSELNLHLEPDKLPFYFITFKVPAHLCLWSEPLVCQFIEEEIEGPVIEEEILVEEMNKKNKKKRHRSIIDLGRKASEAKSMSRNVENNKGVSIVTLEKRDQSRQMGRDSPNIYSLTALDMLRKSALDTEALGGDAYVMHNFELNVEPLSRQRASLLKSACMPRTISSFRFPQEFKEEKDQQIEQVRKNAPGTIHRRRLNDSVIDEEVTKFTLSYEDQANPERLFPRFPRLEAWCKLDKSEEADGPGFTDTSLYGLIQTLDGIRNQYEDSPKKLAAQATTQDVKILKRRTRLTLSAHQPLVNVEREIEMDIQESEDDAKGARRKSKLPSLPMTRGPRQPECIKVVHWTTEFILESDFDKASRILTVKTDRLGNFGFAYPRYTHFPFRNWNLEANEENPDEIIFTLDTYHVRVIFFIGKDGIRGCAIDLPKEFVARPHKYLDMEKYVGDFVELRKLFQDRNLNVFAELDACFYIDQGYFSQKHLAAELHVYDAMAVHCKLIKFKWSDWNRLATDRDIVLCLRNPKDTLDNAEVTVRVTPEASTFVEVSEPCSDNLNTFMLHYHSTWRNIGNYSDLHQLINSMYPHATDMRNRDARQMYYLRKLLQEIRPLSFS